MAQVRPTVIIHTSDIDNTNTLRGRKAKDFILPDGVKVARVLFNSNFIDYIISNDDVNQLNVTEFLDSIHNKIESVLKYEFELKNGLKANMQLLLRYVNGIGVYMDFAYKTVSASLSNEDDIKELIQNIFHSLLADIENRELQESGWMLYAIKRIDLKISKHVYLPGRCFLAIPKWITLKKATLAVKNLDNYCFKWSIIYAFLHKQQIKITKRNVLENEHSFNFNINFPPYKNDISKFCTLNKVSVHVFGIIGKHFYPIYLCKKIKNAHFNLLYIENGSKAHYCPIVNLSRLIGSQITKNSHKKYFCLRCFLHFPTQLRLDVHINACGNEQIAKISLPKERHFLKFDRVDACQKNHIIMTADIESFLKEIHTCAPEPDNSFTIDLQKHEIASVAFFCKVLIDTPQAKLIPAGYRGFIYKEGECLEEKVMTYFEELTKAAKNFYDFTYPIHMSEQDEKKFKESTECYACHKPFTASTVVTRDHDHAKPENNFRGASCSACNLLMRRRKVIPIYCHALSTYDASFFIKLFAKRKIKINVIPYTLERYLSFAIYLNGVELRFLDSLRLFNAKLEKVAETLPKENFVETKKHFSFLQTQDLIFSKLSFPYTFLNSPESLECKEIPPKSYFDNDLTETKVSDQEYENSKLLWKELNCKTFADFVLHYNASDVLLLIDIIISFRQLIYEKFGLEMTSFLSLPHLSLTAMLKISKVEIEVFNESQHVEYDLIKRSIFGGFVSSNVRYTEAENNLHMEYIDATSMYLSQMYLNKLPISDYTLVPFDSEDWQRLDCTGEHGYFLEVNLTFPAACHDYLQCYPPVVDRVIPPGAKTMRLVASFSDKEHYVLSLQHFQLILRLGVQCTRIWQVLRFKQASYMKPYIDIIAKWRNEVKGNCFKSIIKLIMVSNFGKMIEQIENRRCVHITTDEKRLQKLIRKGTFLDRHLYNFSTFSMCLVEMARGVVIQNRPIAVGAMILSLSKVFMINFWYNILKPNFNSIRLIFTDTDSFNFSYKSDNPIEIFKKLAPYFDYSNLDESHALYSTENKGVLGKFKLESEGNKIKAVVSVKSKVYCILYENSCLKKLKGIQRNYVLNKVTFNDYLNCVKNDETRFALYKSIICREFQLYTVQQSKLALSNLDYKRHLLPCRNFTLPHSHYAIKS